MANKDFVLNGILEDILFLVKILGLKKLRAEITKLKESVYKEPSLLEIAKNIVCESYCIAEDKFLTSTDRKNQVIYNARSIYAYLLTEFCYISAKDIAFMFKYNTSTVYVQMNYIKALDPDFKQDKDVLDKLNEIKAELSKQILIPLNK